MLGIKGKTLNCCGRGRIVTRNKASERCCQFCIYSLFFILWTQTPPAHPCYFWLVNSHLSILGYLFSISFSSLSSLPPLSSLSLSHALSCSGRYMASSSSWAKSWRLGSLQYAALKPWWPWSIAPEGSPGCAVPFCQVCDHVKCGCALGHLSDKTCQEVGIHVVPMRRTCPSAAQCGGKMEAAILVRTETLPDICSFIPQDFIGPSLFFFSSFCFVGLCCVLKVEAQGPWIFQMSWHSSPEKLLPTMKLSPEWFRTLLGRSPRQHYYEGGVPIAKAGNELKDCWPGTWNTVMRKCSGPQAWHSVYSTVINHASLKKQVSK